jgi:hypothetical protein
MSPQQSAHASIEDDETSLNAAAAREVSRELDALMFSSPLKSPEPSASRPDPLKVPDPPFVRRLTPSRSSLAGEPSMSSSARNELTYVRERDRSSTGSPTSPTSYRSPLATSTVSRSADGHEPLPPPPPISLPPRGASPAPSSSTATPYRTPLEFPAPPTGPGSFYSLPSASGSGSLSLGGGNGARTISAAAFKRQLRNPSQPPIGDRSPDTTSLAAKRRLPSTPLPAHRLQPGEMQQRVSSAPDSARPTVDVHDDGRNRSSSATYSTRQSHDVGPAGHDEGEGDHGEDDHYDYISAYADEAADPSSAQATLGSHSDARYSADVDH